jgi:hypothetical protein
MNNILGIGTAHKGEWAGCDASIPDLAHLFVGFVSGEDKFASKLYRKIFKKRAVIIWISRGHCNFLVSSRLLTKNDKKKGESARL